MIRKKLLGVGMVAALLCPLTASAQYEVGLGENSLSAYSQYCEAKGDLITWDGVNGYISSRAIYSSGTYKGMAFDLVDQNGCLIHSWVPTLAASSSADMVTVTAIKTVGPDEFVFVGSRYQSNGECVESSFDIVVGYHSRTQPWTNWIHTYGDAGSDEFVRDVIIDSDENIVFTGTAQRSQCAYPDDGGDYLRKFLLVGKLRMDGTAPSDGGVRIYRESQFVVQTGMNRNFGFEGNAIIEQDTPGGGKEYVIGGTQESNDFGYPQAFIMRIEYDITKDTLRKTKRLPFITESQGMDVIKLDNGDLALVGGVSDLPSSQGGSDAFVTVFPAAITGVPCANHPRSIFGDSGDDVAESIISDNNGAYYISGTSTSFTTNSRENVFLLKGEFDVNGSFDIEPNTVPAKSVSFFGGNPREFNHNVVLDERFTSKLHLFNNRNSGSNVYPNYQVNVSTASRSTDCEITEDFVEYSEGECVALNTAKDYRNESIPDQFEEEFSLREVDKTDYCGTTSCKHTPDGQQQAATPEKAATNAFAVFPNPANEQLTLQGTERPEHIRILDVKGSQVMNITPEVAGNQLLDISKLESGIYFVQVQATSGTHSFKFVKQ